MNNKEINALLNDCYVELYHRSTPSGDFNELNDNAVLNDRGEREIPFNDYVIDDELMTIIIHKYAKQIKPSWMRTRFVNEIYLGCSPKSIRKNTNTNQMEGSQQLTKI
jgi:hypothetical protein